MWDQFKARMEGATFRRVVETVVESKVKYVETFSNGLVIITFEDGNAISGAQADLGLMVAPGEADTLLVYGPTMSATIVLAPAPAEKP